MTTVCAVAVACCVINGWARLFELVVILRKSVWPDGDGGNLTRAHSFKGRPAIQSTSQRYLCSHAGAALTQPHAGPAPLLAIPTSHA